MELMLLRSFQHQVLLQCDFMFLAADDLNTGLKQMDTTHIFYALQNLLTAAANISKALWGVDGTPPEKRKELRDSLGISDDSLLKDVRMRNNFEHYDERLEKWWKESSRHNMADQNIGPKSAIGGMDQLDLFRHFDPQTTDLYFWGQQFNIQALINEVQKFLPTLRTEASKAHWEK